MTCPFLRGTMIPVCTAYGSNYLPSNFEFEKYCRGDKSKICPYPSLRLFGVGCVDHGGVRRESRRKAA
jgi:hypothetical protein